MKNFFILSAVLAALCLPTSTLMAQKTFGEELLEAFVQGMIEGLVEDLVNPESETETKIISKSDITGVWEFPNGLAFIEENGNYSQSTSSYSEITFSGTYALSDDLMSIFDSKGTFMGTWTLSPKDNKLTFTTSDGSAKTTGVYKCSVTEFFQQKNRELANLEANTERFVTEQQGYIQSKTIRHDVQTATTRRSYDAERVKAIENTKYYRQQGNETQARAWEAKAADYDREINKLDGN